MKIGALSGSLTKLLDGTSYLVAGTNITITTGSGGEVTIDASGGGGGSPAAPFDSVQYNDAGSFGGSTNFRFIESDFFLILTGSFSQGEDVNAAGANSHAEGNRNTAQGQYAHAEGQDNLAFGRGSHAEGLQTISFGFYTHTEGEDTFAYGFGSHAEGLSSVASGSRSHAEGYATIADGDVSHAEGYLTVASGSASHAEGILTVASGSSSHTEGSLTVTYGVASHAEGSGSIAGVMGYEVRYVSSGNYQYTGQDLASIFPQDSYVIIESDDRVDHEVCKVTNISWNGSQTDIFVDPASTINPAIMGSAAQFTLPISSDPIVEAKPLNADQSMAWYSHSEGVATYANGMHSHAEGSGSIAAGLASHAEGRRSIALGKYSHAEGDGSVALGQASHAQGASIASGNYSYAAGASIALGYGSHSEGLGTIASGSHQKVSGKYNLRNNDFSIMVVGNGTGDPDANRSDIVRIQTDSVQITGSFIQANIPGLVTPSLSTVGFMGDDIGTTAALKGTDVFFYVSGSGGTKDTATRGVALFGGDVVISGTLHGGSPLKIGSDLQITGSLDISGSLNVQTAIFSGDLIEITGSLSVTQGISGSLTQLVDGTSYLIAGTNVTITSASNGAITIDAAGGSPGGSDTEIQYNSAGSFTGSSDFTYNGTTVYLTGSFSQGNNANAFGDYSHAEGTGTVAIVSSSHSEGNFTRTGLSGFLSNDISSTVQDEIVLDGAYGDVTVLFTGQTAVVVDTGYDNVIGYKTYSVNSTSFNSPNTILAFSTTIPFTTTAVIGIQGDPNPPGADVPLGQHSHAEGDGTITVGDGAHAEGGSTVAAGNYSHAEGGSGGGGTLVASGEYSHAEGYNTLASGSNSHAEGYSTIAAGYSSHAEGSSTVAIGSYSHAEGVNTIAFADYSHAEGEGTIASGSYQHAGGMYNVRGNDFSLFVIGNGTSDADVDRSDIFRVNTSSVQVSGSLIVSGAYILNVMSGTTTPTYTIGSAEHVVVFTDNVVTATLPSSSPIGRKIIFKDGTGAASSAGGQMLSCSIGIIDGSATYTLPSIDYTSVSAIKINDPDEWILV